MASQLVVVGGPDEGKSFVLKKGQTLLVGRAQGADIRLTDSRVSRRHCRVDIDGGCFVLTDLESRAGTFVNGRQITQHALEPGDAISIGQSEIRFQLEGAPDASALTARATPDGPGDEGASGGLGGLVGHTIHCYRIDKALATGSTGMVFLATDTETDDQVALKVLWPAVSRDDDEMRRFLRAMKAMVKVQHPNLVSLYRAGRHGPHCWLAMEHVEGESLTHVIRRVGVAGMLEWTVAFRVGVHVGRALQAAYQHKIIHRNIKPSNILIRSKDKQTKLGDTMVAKALKGTLAEKVTRPGQLVGDARYMSPERTRSTGEVDTRSDIYSLGATLYALLAGRPPFEGSSLPDLVTQIRETPPVPPKQFQLSIPDLFEGAILRMLAKRPDDRYQTPAELVTDLERIGKFQGVEA